MWQFKMRITIYSINHSDEHSGWTASCCPEAMWPSSGGRLILHHYVQWDPCMVRIIHGTYRLPSITCKQNKLTLWGKGRTRNSTDLQQSEKREKKNVLLLLEIQPEKKKNMSPLLSVASMQKQEPTEDSEGTSILTREPHSKFSLADKWRAQITGIYWYTLI